MVGGGGLSLSGYTLTLNANTFISNTADYGGGLYLGAEGDVALTNNVIADNHARTAASGLYIWRSPAQGQLSHNTIARNTGGDGSGVYVTNSGSNYSTVLLTNTILVGHTTGITVTPGNTARLTATLWGAGDWANAADWGGGGTITTGTVNVRGNPAFADPDAGDYHIRSGSAAIDAGVDARVSIDLDGEPRPTGSGYDIGADESYYPTLKVTKHAYPSPVQAGERLTYTIRVTNTGNVTLSATVTDVLPNHITPGETPGGSLILPGGTITWTPVIVTPGDVWTETVVVTVDVGCAVPLTNVVQVTSAEGASGIYTNIVPLPLAFGVEFAPDHVGSADPGTIITYTHTLTNSGNVTGTFDLIHYNVLGWLTMYDTPVIVGQGQTATVIVNVVIPTDSISGTMESTLITATLRAATDIYAVVTDTSVVNHVPGVALAPDRSVTINPDNVITYTHVLTNTGNGPDSFDLAHESDQGWAVQYTTPISVGYNQTSTVFVRISVAAGSSGLTDTSIITATSQANTSARAAVTDVTIVNTAPVAIAGFDQSVVPSTSVLLDGSGSTDPDGHLPLTYRWQQIEGPFAVLVGAGNALATFQAPPYQSVLTFTLVVTDTLGLGSSPDTIVVYVEGGDTHRVYLPLVLRSQ